MSRRRTDRVGLIEDAVPQVEKGEIGSPDPHDEEKLEFSLCKLIHRRAREKDISRITRGLR